MESKIQKWRQQVNNYTKREKLFLFFIVILIVVSLVFVICLLTSKNDGGICLKPQCITAAHHIISTVDPTIDPCEDFYNFACGNFHKTAIANDQVSPLKALEDLQKSALQQLVMQDLKDERNLTKSFRDQRKFFRSCMNTSAIEEDKDKTFLEILKYVTGGWPLSQGYTLGSSWTEIMVKAREKGMAFNYFLGISTSVDFNSSSNYLEIKPPPIDYSSKELWREGNVQKIIEMAEHWGNHSVSASWEIRETIKFAENLRKIIEKANNATKNMTIADQKIKISQLRDIFFPAKNWLQFLKNMTGLDNLQEDDVILYKLKKEEYFSDLYYLLQKTQQKFWVNYIAIILITDDCRSLSKKIEASCLEILHASKKSVTRKDYCFSEAIGNFDGVAEAQYIRQTVTKEKRKHINKIIDAVKAEMGDSLKQSKWMDDKTKKEAITHLKKIKAAIGWTDIVFDEQKFEMLFSYNKEQLASNNLIQITRQLNKAYLDYKFKKVTKKVNETFAFEFELEHALSVPVLEVNALYANYWDVLILVAPILHQPVYDLNRPQYLNYGALGSIIGHELTHAFAKLDDETRHKFGKYILDYWTNKTKENYELEKECLNEEYELFGRSSGINLVNGSVSLLENIADFTGLNLAYRAYQKYVDLHGVENQLPGVKFTPNQLFWIMSSTFLCLEPKLKDPEKAHSHPEKQEPQKHAFAKFRVAGPIRNSPYFADDWGCKKGSQMNPEKKCRLFL